ncbi:MAG: FGGY-family carbohydrate kinase [Pseudomonadota bacterium]
MDIKDCVIGIDCSTTATKAIAWLRDGSFLAEGRCPISLNKPKPGHFEQKAEDWWTSTANALRQLTGKIDPSRIAAVAVSNQRETFCVLDKDDQPLLPGTVWLDERALDQQRTFADQYGADYIRGVSGKPVDVIVPLYRMLWIAEHYPDIYAQIDRFADVHCYVVRRLTGHWATSIASADPMGLVDMTNGAWSQDLLRAANINPAIMPDLVRPGDVIGYVTPAAADATGLPKDVPIVAGGGDGQCAATGTGTVEPGIAYMNLGTALVAGCYSKGYAHSQAFRTETAVSDDGYIFETLLKAGTFLIDWMTEQMARVKKEDQVAFLTALEAEARQSPVGAGGLVVLPYWQGSMTPNWDSEARGIIAGLSGSTTSGDMYRALLEGLALDTAQAFENVREATGRRLKRVVAIGGGSSSELFLSILADALNVEVMRAETPEASSLGAAMAAAKGAGWFASLSEASRAMKGQIAKTVQPNAARAERYQDLRALHSRLWPLLSDWNADVRQFAKRHI